MGLRLLNKIRCWLGAHKEEIVFSVSTEPDRLSYIKCKHCDKTKTLWFGDFWR